MLNKGKNRVHEKVKDMRQNYSKAVVNETHSGCERILYKHYDKLEPIWSVLQIPNLFHIVYEVMILKMAIIVKKFVTVVIIMMMRMVVNTNETSDTANNVSQNKSDSIEDENYETISPMKNCKKSESLLYLNWSIINADTHKNICLQPNLTSCSWMSQKKMNFCRDFPSAVRKSTVSFTASMKNIGRSMTQLGESLCQSTEMLWRIMCDNSNISGSSMMPLNQNLIYRNKPRQQQLVYSKGHCTN